MKEKEIIEMQRLIDEGVRRAQYRLLQRACAANQTLVVQVLNPALRADLSMMRQKLVKRLNDAVGSYVISDIKFY